MLLPIKNWLQAKSLAIAILVSLGVIVLSLLNLSTVPDLHLKISDKFLHSLAYLVLIWSWLLYLRDKRSFKTRVLLIIFLTLFGIILEVLQGISFIGRTQDIKDVVANVVGLILGLLTFDFLYRILFKKENN